MGVFKKLDGIARFCNDVEVFIVFFQVFSEIFTVKPDVLFP